MKIEEAISTRGQAKVHLARWWCEVCKSWILYQPVYWEFWRWCHENGQHEGATSLEVYERWADQKAHETS